MPVTVVWTGNAREYNDWRGRGSNAFEMHWNVTTLRSIEWLRGIDLRGAALVCVGTWDRHSDGAETLDALARNGVVVPPALAKLLPANFPGQFPHSRAKLAVDAEEAKGAVAELEAIAASLGERMAADQGVRCQVVDNAVYAGKSTPGGYQ